MRTPRLVPTLVLLLLAACGGGGGGGQTAGTPVPTIPPNPNGVLLPGDPDALAVDVLPRMAPSAVPAADLREDGYLSTRMEALIALDATVQEVNDALELLGLKIVSMDPGLPVVTLVAPDLPASGMIDLVQALRATGAFSLATLSYAAFEAQEVGTFAGISLPDPAYAVRLRAAHRAAPLAQQLVAPRVPVLIPGHFGRLDPDPRIQALSIEDGPGVVSPFAPNHGFIDAALIGKDPEDVGSLAVHPTAAEDLELRGMPVGGLTWSERLRAIAARIPASGPCVVYTGLEYGDDFAARDGEWRAVDALLWRSLLPHQRFVHVTTAGEGLSDAAQNSPFALAAEFGVLSELVLGASEAVTIAGLEARLGDVGTTATENLRTVGGISHIDLATYGPASQTADLRAVGDAFVPCWVFDEECGSITFQLVHAARAAAAQVAGLAAYLWTLDPGATAQEILAAIDAGAAQGVTPNLVNFYAAALALDATLPNTPVRRTVLDVTGAADAPDGVFDERDLTAWLAGILDAGEDRFDLNGNELVGGDAVAPFDLDADGANGVATSPLEIGFSEYDETGVTDNEVLRFFAYSPLYQGDSGMRAELLAGTNGLGGAWLVDAPNAIRHSTFATARVGGAANTLTFTSSLPSYEESYTQTRDEPDGFADAKVGIESEVHLGPAGNLVGLTVSGIGSAQILLRDPEVANLARSIVEDRIEFVATDSPHFSATLTYTVTSGPGTELDLQFGLFYGDSFVFTGPVDVPVSGVPGFASASGGLPDLEEGELFHLVVTSSATAGDIVDVTDDALVSFQWQLEFTLEP